MKAFLLWQWHFLHMKTRQIRHFTFKLGKINSCIDFVSKQYRFLFVNPFLVGTNLDKKFISIYWCSRHIQLLTTTLMVSRCATISFCCSRV